jgi:hypothetical protein
MVAMDLVEYLVGYGLQGDFGRFRPAQPLTCRRGDRVVVRSVRGLEVGRVLCEATPRHAHFLPNTTLAPLLRPAGPDDDRQEGAMRERGRHLLDRASALGTELALPLEVLDAEVLLDGQSGVLHLLRWAEADVRPFVSTLSREEALAIALVDLAAPPAAEEHPGCGSCGAGGCGSCGTGGGCGSCGSARPEEVRAYFAGLREQMDRRHTLL